MKFQFSSRMKVTAWRHIYETLEQSMNYIVIDLQGLAVHLDWWDATVDCTVERR